jgi:hypothetical protein
MYRRLLQLSLAAAVASAPLALHADSMTGQFAITGTVQNSGTTLVLGTGAVVGTGTQTGTFLTLLSAGQAVTAPTADIPYSPYSANSFYFGIGPVTGTLETLTETTVGSTLDFSGVANLASSGFTDTLADYSFSVPSSGTAQFTATFVALAPPSAVPEPSSIALLGSGMLGLVGSTVRKFRNAKA